MEKYLKRLMEMKPYSHCNLQRDSEYHFSPLEIHLYKHSHHFAVAAPMRALEGWRSRCESNEKLPILNDTTALEQGRHSDDVKPCTLVSLQTLLWTGPTHKEHLFQPARVDKNFCLEEKLISWWSSTVSEWGITEESLLLFGVRC